MGGKPEAEREGGRKMSTEDSHIWPVLFLGFSPNKYGGKNAQFPKMNLTNTGTQTWSAFSLLLTSQTQTHKVLIYQPSVIN